MMASLLSLLPDSLPRLPQQPESYAMNSLHAPLSHDSTAPRWEEMAMPYPLCWPPMGTTHQKPWCSFCSLVLWPHDVKPAWFHLPFEDSTELLPFLTPRVPIYTMGLPPGTVVMTRQHKLQCGWRIVGLSTSHSHSFLVPVSRNTTGWSHILAEPNPGALGKSHAITTSSPLPRRVQHIY